VVRAEIARLRDELVGHWDRDTSACPDRWTPGRPSLGQCAGTALIVQDEFGGDLRRSVVNGESHYFNLVDGWVDLTLDQFDAPFVMTEFGRLRTRSYVLSSPDTSRRYAVLRRRFDAP
jgi:hypothetical protein